MLKANMFISIPLIVLWSYIFTVCGQEPGKCTPFCNDCLFPNVCRCFLSDITNGQLVQECCDGRRPIPPLDYCNEPTTKPTTIQSSTSTTMTTISNGTSSAWNITPTTQFNNTEMTTTPTEIIKPLKCNSDGQYNKTYGFDYWIPVEPNKTSSNSCPNGYSGTATWLCLKNSEFDPKGPFINCTKDWTSSILKSLTFDMKTEALITIGKDANNRMFKEEFKFLEELKAMADIFDKIQKITDHKKDSSNFNETKDSIGNIVEGTSIMLDKANAWDNARDDEKVKLGSKMLQCIQKSAFTLGDKQTNENSRINQNNIVINTFSINPKTTIEFIAKDSKLFLPEGFYLKDKATYYQSAPGDSKTAVGAVFEKIGDVLTSEYDENDFIINSDVIAFSFAQDFEKHKLGNNKKVKIITKHKTMLEFGDKMKCVYWEFSENKWSSDGCVYNDEESDRMQTVCECDHLSSLAPLLDIRGREKNARSKNILSIVTTVISTISMILTIFIFLIVGDLRKRKSTIVINVCINLLIMTNFATFGMDKTENSTVCQTISAIIVFTFLASFMWMLMCGYHLWEQLMTIQKIVGDKDRPNELSLVKLYGLGYGLPMAYFVVILISMASNGHLQGQYFCWITTPRHPRRIYWVMIPAVIVLGLNVILMIYSAIILYRNKIGKTPEETPESESSGLCARILKISGYISLMLIMGATWLTFTLYVLEVGHGLSYVFIILNGLQGFFIFIMEIVLNQRSRYILGNHSKSTYRSFRHMISVISDKTN